MRILWIYDPFFNSLLLAPTPNFLLLITYIRLPRLPSSCDWLILANSIGLPRTTFKQKVYVCISVYIFSTCHWIFLNTIGINAPLRRVQPALQARNPTHCFECFPDALKFGPIQLHRRIGAVTLPTQDTFFYFASCNCIPVQAVEVSGPFSVLPVSAFMSGLTIVENSLLKAVIRIKQSVRKPGLRSN